jgi:hypothetical protein
VLYTAENVVALLLMRLVTGRNWATVVIGGMLFGVFWFINQSFGLTGPETPLATLAWCAAYGIVTVLILTRVGLLAAFVMLAVTRFPAPMTTDLSAWYGPYAIASFVVIFAVAGYGFWLALAGQPIFKDILSPEKGRMTADGRS